MLKSTAQSLTKVRFLLLFAAIFVMLLDGAASASQGLQDAFRSPSSDARPHVRWWWPGAAVTNAELADEIVALDSAGFGGAEIQAFAIGLPKLQPAERDAVNQYAEPPFFDHVRAVADAARAKGMSLDYTFGSAWPPGGGQAITPELSLLELTMGRTEVMGGTGPIKLTIPARTHRLGALSSYGFRHGDPSLANWRARLDARAKIIAVVAMKGDAPELMPPTKPAGMKLYPWSDVLRPGHLDQDSVRILTDKLRLDGNLDWTPPPGKWQIFVFKQNAVDNAVLGAAGSGPQLVLDPMNPTAFAAHAARVGDPLGARTAGIRCMFVDSAEYFQDLPWTDQFLAEFRERRGYDLTPFLPFIVQPGWMEAWNAHWSLPYFVADNNSRTGKRKNLNTLYLFKVFELL